MLHSGIFTGTGPEIDIKIYNPSICLLYTSIVWGISYAKVSTKEFLKMSVVCGWIICCILQVITFIMFG